MSSGYAGDPHRDVRPVRLRGDPVLAGQARGREPAPFGTHGCVDVGVEQQLHGLDHREYDCRVGSVSTGDLRNLRLGSLQGDGIGRRSCPPPGMSWTPRCRPQGFRRWSGWPLPIGLDAIESHGSPMPESTLVALAELDSWILGPHDSASYPDPFQMQLTPGGTIRKRFRPVRQHPAGAGPARVRAVSPRAWICHRPGEHRGLLRRPQHVRGHGEFMPTPDVAMAVGVVTRQACERIAHTAFGLAMRRRKRVTVVHKRTCWPPPPVCPRRVPRRRRALSGVRLDDEHVDAMAAYLLRRGEDYDVVVTENMFRRHPVRSRRRVVRSLGTRRLDQRVRDEGDGQAAHGAPRTSRAATARTPVALFLSARCFSTGSRLAAANRRSPPRPRHP